MAMKTGGLETASLAGCVTAGLKNPAQTNGVEQHALPVKTEKIDPRDEESNKAEQKNKVDSSDRPTTRSDNRATTPTTCCMRCDTEHSELWHKTPQGIVLCSACSQDTTNSMKGYKNKLNCKRINNLHSKKFTAKGAKKSKESRKKSLHKLPYKEATYITSNRIYYKGVQYKVGDVFSIRGKDRLYYVCIRSFMEDPLCHQYAVIIWLLPLYPNPAHYSPTDFLLGPAEDVPRPMDCLSFVSHDAPQGHITLNELQTYDKIPDIFGGCSKCTTDTSEKGDNSRPPDKSGLDLLLEVMAPDMEQINR